MEYPVPVDHEQPASDSGLHDRHEREQPPDGLPRGEPRLLKHHHDPEHADPSPGGLPGRYIVFKPDALRDPPQLLRDDERPSEGDERSAGCDCSDRRPHQQGAFECSSRFCWKRKHEGGDVLFALERLHQRTRLFRGPRRLDTHHAANLWWGCLHRQ